MQCRLIAARSTPPRARVDGPQRLDQLPRFAAIVRSEQAARDRAGPQRAIAVESGFQCPDVRERPRSFVAPHVDVDETVGLRRVLGDADLDPGVACVVGTVQLDAEMPVVEYGVPGTITGVGGSQGHVVADEMLSDDPGTGARTIQDEQSLARGHMDEWTHDQPPDSACMT